MHNNWLQLKFRERLNKVASLDYDNFESWQIAEAYNKGRLTWLRTQLEGLNQRKSGADSSRGMIDDLQVLITRSPLTGTTQGDYFETALFPENYIAFSRIDCTASAACCPSRPINAYLATHSDTTVLLRDENHNPSFEWAETFITLAGNRAQIYHDGKFNVDTVTLIYYKKPDPVVFAGQMDPVTGNLATVDVSCIFKDDICEILVDEAVAILAGDTENFNQMSRLKTSAESAT